jgi:phage tail-like protein
MKMARGDGNEMDPLIGFNFGLEIEGKMAGFFQECSGIGSENEVIDHKVVDTNGIEMVRKIPGRLKWGDVTLKRGITTDMEIWDWRNSVVQGKMDDARTNCSVIMMDRDYTPKARWNFFNAWPSKVSGPSVKSDSNEIGVEEVTLVHEGLERES